MKENQVNNLTPNITEDIEKKIGDNWYFSVFVIMVFQWIRCFSVFERKIRQICLISG